MKAGFRGDTLLGGLGFFFPSNKVICSTYKNILLGFPFRYGRHKGRGGRKDGKRARGLPKWKEKPVD